MNSKITALIVGVWLCGLTAFAGQEYLYDSRGFIYDLGHANYGGFGNSLCLYNVKITYIADTNTTYGTAVILYDSTYGTMKIFSTHQVSASLPPSINGIETRWTGASGTFPGQYWEGSYRVLPIDLSFEPMHAMLPGKSVLNDGLTNGGESAPAQVLPLSADEGISIPKDSIYRFTASASPYYFVFYVFSNEVLSYFPQYQPPEAGYSAARALAMSVDVYYNNTYVAATAGIFYGFQVSSYQFCTYFTVFPTSAFPVSFSILANYFSVRSQNQLSIFTLAQDDEIVVSFLGN